MNYTLKLAAVIDEVVVDNNSCKVVAMVAIVIWRRLTMVVVRWWPEVMDLGKSWQ